MNFYQNELNSIKRSNRFRMRKLFDKNLKDLASNDYLGLSSNKKTLKKAYKKLKKEHYFSPKASMLVNGYSKIHKEFEQKLCEINNFENGIVVGNGFLANISLIESLIRKKDILFIDEEYHASGILATKVAMGEVISFKHNDFNDLKNKLSLINNKNRVVIAIEGVYSMSGDIASKEFYNIANEHDALLVVDEAHSSGIIGKNLLGWFDHFNLKIKANHIKMGTLGKAYGSYGAYILASNEIISFLENRAKPIIYSTAPSLFDIALGLENLNYIVKNKDNLKKQIKQNQDIVKEIFDINVDSLIVPIVINDNKKVIQIQDILKQKGYLVGAIRQPTVKKAIIRMIIKLDISKKHIKKVLKTIKDFENG